MNDERKSRGQEPITEQGLIPATPPAVQANGSRHVLKRKRNRDALMNEVSQLAISTLKVETENNERRIAKAKDEQERIAEERLARKKGLWSYTLYKAEQVVAAVADCIVTVTGAVGSWITKLFSEE